MRVCVFCGFFCCLFACFFDVPSVVCVCGYRCVYVTKYYKENQGGFDSSQQSRGLSSMNMGTSKEEKKKKVTKILSLTRAGGLKWDKTFRLGKKQNNSHPQSNGEVKILITSQQASRTRKREPTATLACTAQ